MYKPYTLPDKAALCIFECIEARAGSGGGYTMHARPCGAKTTGERSFCKEHDYVLEVLDLGSMLGYPDIQVNTFLWIGRGLENWEAYALRHPLYREHRIACKNGETKLVKSHSHYELKQKLTALVKSMEEENNAARLRAIHNTADVSQPGQEIGFVDVNDKMYVPF